MCLTCTASFKHCNCVWQRSPTPQMRGSERETPFPLPKSGKKMALGFEPRQLDSRVYPLATTPSSPTPLELGICSVLWTWEQVLGKHPKFLAYSFHPLHLLCSSTQQDWGRGWGGQGATGVRARAQQMKAREDGCFQVGRAKLLSLQFLSCSLVSSTGCLRKEMAYSFFIQKRRARKHAKRGGVTNGRKEEGQDTPIGKPSCLLLLYPLFSHCPDPGSTILLLYLPLLYFLSSI